MKYELLYYELKQKHFTKKETLQKFLNTLTQDQILRLLKRKDSKSWYEAVLRRSPSEFII